MTKKILALDFGGTKLAAGVATAGERKWQNTQRQLSPPGASAKTDIEIMKSLARNLLQGEKPGAIGVSFGGPADFATGTVRLSHHVPGWENTPLKQILEAEFDAPAAIDNDANVAALGEHRFGAGEGYDSLLYITISTGVGGGWILNGKPWRGVEGMAGEIGHTVVEPAGPLCLCGKRGCVERLASGPYMARQVREWLEGNKGESEEKGKGRLLRELAGNNLEAIAPPLISEAAARGDEVAKEAIARAGWAVGVAIGNTANLINPQLFVLGGGVTKAGELFWETLRRVARETALPEVKFAIAPAKLEDEAPLWGAVALAEQLTTNN